MLTWRDRLAQQKASQSMSKEERRKAMPYTSEFIDWVREEFGDPVAISASEGGHSIEWRRK